MCVSLRNIPHRHKAIELAVDHMGQVAVVRASSAEDIHSAPIGYFRLKTSPQFQQARHR